MLTLMTRKSSRSPVGRPRAVSPQRSTNSVLAATHSLAAGAAEVKGQRAKGRRSGWGRGGAAEVLKIKCFLHSVFFAEDVGDEGEEEKEFISYSISNDIHYGIKSNR